MRMIWLWLILIVGILLVGSITVLSKNEPLLEKGFKEIRTFVFGGVEQSKPEPTSNAITINPIKTEYIPEYKTRCTGNESVLCQYTNYEIIYKTIIINKTLNITKKVWNKTIFNISSPKEKFNITNKSQYILPNSYPLRKGSDTATPVFVLKSLSKANPLSLTLTKFETGDRVEYIFELPPNTRYAKFGENSIIIIQSEDVVGDSLLSNITAESGEANFTHLIISNTAPYDSLVLYLSFDGDKVNAKTTTHYDFTKEGNDGTGFADALVNSTGCISNYGDCLHLDGTGDYVNVPYDASLEPPDITMSLWINPDGLVSVMAHAADSGHSIFVYGGELRAYRKTTLGPLWQYVAFPSLSGWTHIVYTFNYSGGGNISIYVNGSFYNSHSDAAPTNYLQSDIQIGDCLAYGDFKGQIDEVMIFNTTLTGAQILDIYNNQSARFMKTGTQKVRAVKVTNGTNWDNGGYNRVNLTTTYEANLNSNISARMGQINLSVNNSGLVAYYPFEWGSAVDISGEGNDGTFAGDAFINESGLNDTRGLQLDGAGDYVDVGNIAEVDGTTEFSISVWIFRGDDTSDYIVSKWDTSGGGSDKSFKLRADPGVMNWEVHEDGVYGTNVVEIDGATSIPLTTWNHVVGTFKALDANGFRLYINGVEDGNSPISTEAVSLSEANSVPIYIGDSYEGLGSFNGAIDEVLIFNRSLSATEVLNLYTNQSGKKNIAYYTDYQNLTGTHNNFTINPEADFIFPDLKFYAGNSSHPFYTPILNGSITLETWNYTAVEDTTAPAYSNFQDNASSDTTNSTDVQLNVTITDATGIDYYRLATNNTDGNALTNGSLIDAGDAGSLIVIFNESIAWFPTTGGTMGWQIWSNDTGGYISVSAMQTFTVASVDSCTCPASGDWHIINGDECTLSSVCELGSNIFRVIDGKMRILSSGYLRAGGCYVTDTHSLFIDDGGGLYCGN